MRNALIFTSLLLVLAMGGICAVHIQVNAPRDQVEITETVLYGDKSIAEGITINNRRTYYYHLFWDTRYVVGEPPLTSTQYLFDGSKWEQDFQTSYSGLELDGYYNRHFSHYPENYRDGSPNRTPTGLDVARKELMDTLAPAETDTIIVHVKDYYDYYPFGGSIHLPGYALSWDVDYDPNSTEYSESDAEKHAILTIRDFFKFPVPEDERIMLTGEKSGDGSYLSTTMLRVKSDYFDFITTSVITDSVYYFTFDSHTVNGNIVDTSLIPGGYGLYRLPYEAGGNGRDGSIDVDALAMVYPLDPNTSVQAMNMNSEQTKLFLHTRENDKYVFTVIDIATMETLQRLEVTDWPEVVDPAKVAQWTQDHEDYLDFNLSYRTDDFFVVALFGYQLALVTVTDTGDYQVEFVIEMTKNENWQHCYGSLSMDYDGQRLVVGCFDREATGTPINLSVYDASGHLYSGQYTNSLNSERFEYISRRFYCQPVDDTLSVSWDG